MGKKEFVAATLDPEHEAFEVHIAAFSVNSSNEVHPSKSAQIAHMKADEALSKVLNKYTDFANIFFPKLAIELLEHVGINDYLFKLLYD